MRRPLSTSSLPCVAILLWIMVQGAAPAVGQTRQDAVRPVTDAELQNPNPNDWLMWRRTLDSWGHSPPGPDQPRQRRGHQDGLDARPA